MNKNTALIWQYGIILLAFLAGMIFQSSIQMVGQDSSLSRYESGTTSVTQNELDNLLKIPKKEDEAKVRSHLELVSRLAIPSTSLDISGCLPDPIVIAIPHQKTLSVRNDDDKSHTIYLSPTDVFEISAKTITDIVADFEFGQGVYGFSCDDPSKTVGILFVHSLQ